MGLIVKYEQFKGLISGKARKEAALTKDTITLLQSGGGGIGRLWFWPSFKTSTENPVTTRKCITCYDFPRYKKEWQEIFIIYVN